VIVSAHSIGPAIVSLIDSLVVRAELVTVRGSAAVTIHES